MDSFRFARQKIKQICAEIGRVRASDFHHPDIKWCLADIEAIFAERLQELDGVPPDTAFDVRRGLCSDINVDVGRFHNILGIILRSTNARNSFEVFDPLLRVAKRLLGSGTTLVLSSEWEFSPFMDPSVVDELPNCVFVGLPAMESSNALIVPLAGHELGHSAWTKYGISSEIRTSKERALASYFARRGEDFKRCEAETPRDLGPDIVMRDWGALPLVYMEWQCEEIFCDFIGLSIFREGYLHAFEYLAAPNIGPTDLRLYPSMEMRSRYLRYGARRLGFAMSRRYLDGFEERVAAGLEDEEGFLIEASQGACRSLVPQLLRLATGICARAGLTLPSTAAARHACERFRYGIPAEGMRHLADVINAGWLAYLDDEFWEDRPRWRERKFELLNELILKSLNVMELEARTSDAT
jgi:hypothetical protein